MFNFSKNIKNRLKSEELSYKLHLILNTILDNKADKPKEIKKLTTIKTILFIEEYYNKRNKNDR